MSGHPTETERPAGADRLLNPSDEAAFVSALSAVVEHSPWVAEQAYEHRPFAGLAELHAAFHEALMSASTADQLIVLNAHPDLAVRTAQPVELTAESTAEQAGAGLDRLAEDRRLALAASLAAYRDRFGFPFIACVRDHGGAGLEELVGRRIDGTRQAELAVALREVSSIARHRLADLVGQDAA